MKDLERYKQYFSMIDDRTPFSLFKKYVFELIELAEDQQPENHSCDSLPNLNGRGATPVHTNRKERF